ncbi:ABC transporter permease [Arthrobacter ginkgonis]|uniref:ABC transporter permease n=1 Tax=Arthrobacter ginkgonis TaxID=1630594 RepID=A0ABP7BNP8_9MICC
MTQIILRRLLSGIPLLLGVSFVTFILIGVAPGDAAMILAGAEATPAEYQALRQELGLNEPLLLQYWHWLVNAVQGDMGKSIVNGQDVVQSLNERLGVTLSIVIPSVAISAFLGVLVGCISAHRGRWLGRTVDFAAVFGSALPNFWIALIVVTLLAVTFPIFPAIGYVSPTVSLSGWATSITLPVLSMVIGGFAGIAKQTRDAMLTGLSAEYTLAHRADGVREGTIVYWHTLRNSAAPILAIIGLNFVGSLGGTVLIEKIFGLPGLGGIAVSATSQRDITTIQGVVVYFAILAVLVNLVLDLTYRRLNPKVQVK